LVQCAEIHPATQGFEISFVSDIAHMIGVAHLERKLEVDRYRSLENPVAEE
jgi:hypothetical protein